MHPVVQTLLIFDMTQDLFLSQHVHDHTRFRQGQNPSLVDYIFTYEENQIDNLIHQAPVAKSDHACLSFDYVAKANECTFSGCEFDYHIRQSLLNSNVLNGKRSFIVKAARKPGEFSGT